MKIIEPSIEILTPQEELDNILTKIERAARTCYKSEDKIADGSAARLVKFLINANHEAMLEHASIAVKFTCDRGVSHELVRHRMASYAQESTRYCNYTSEDKFNGELTFIKPHWIKKSVKELVEGSYNEGDIDKNEFAYLVLCNDVEDDYRRLVKSNGLTLQDARGCLNHWVKTEVVMTANIREWRHFFKLRTAKDAHPDMRRIALMALKELKARVPVIFDDIEIEEN